MREKTRAREEHPEGDERRRTNGRPRRADEHGPPRRPAHYVARGRRSARAAASPRASPALIGLLATAVLLAVGVTVVLMVTRDNGTEPPETFAAARTRRRRRKKAGVEAQAAASSRRPSAPRATPPSSRSAARASSPSRSPTTSRARACACSSGGRRQSTGVRGRRAFFFAAPRLPRHRRRLAQPARAGAAPARRRDHARLQAASCPATSRRTRAASWPRCASRSPTAALVPAGPDPAGRQPPAARRSLDGAMCGRYTLTPGRAAAGRRALRARRGRDRAGDARALQRLPDRGHPRGHPQGAAGGALGARAVVLEGSSTRAR